MKIYVIVLYIIASVASLCKAQTFVMKVVDSNGGIINGNSNIPGYPNNDGWSIIHGFNHVTSNNITNLSGSNSPQTAPQSGVIEISKAYYPNVSNHFSKSLNLLSQYEKIIIVGLILAPNSSFVKFVEYDFRNVYVGNFMKIVENSGSGFDLIDKLSLRAGAMYIRHYTIDSNGNNSTLTAETGWNFKTNQSWDGTGQPAF